MQQKSRPVTACSGLVHTANNHNEQPLRLSCSPCAHNDVDELPLQELHPASTSDLSLLSLDKQPFYLRLLQRDNSGQGVSRRRLTVPSFVPFLWELSPGLPKPNWARSSEDRPQQDDAAAGPAYNISSSFINMRPLALPPFMQQHPLSISTCSGYSPHHGRLQVMKRPDAKDLSNNLKSKLKAAVGYCGRRRRSSGAGINSGGRSASTQMLLLRNRDAGICSPTSNTSLQLMTTGSTDVSCSSSSSDFEHFYHFSANSATASCLDLGGEIHSRAQFQGHSLAYKPKVLLPSWMNRKTTTKMKGCCCFHMSNCET